MEFQAWNGGVRRYNKNVDKINSYQSRAIEILRKSGMKYDKKLEAFTGNVSRRDLKKYNKLADKANKLTYKNLKRKQRLEKNKEKLKFNKKTGKYSIIEDNDSLKKEGIKSKNSKITNRKKNNSVDEEKEILRDILSSSSSREEKQLVKEMLLSLEKNKKR